MANIINTLKRFVWHNIGIFFSILLVLISVGCARGDDRNTEREKQLKNLSAELEELVGHNASIIPPSDQIIPGLEDELEKARKRFVPFSELGYRRPASGVDTGYVFFLGHYIPPPYEFKTENASGQCFLNGIEVFPGNRYDKYLKENKIITPERMQELDNHDNKWRELTGYITEVFKSELKKRGIEIPSKKDCVELPEFYKSMLKKRGIKIPSEEGCIKLEKVDEAAFSMKKIVERERGDEVSLSVKPGVGVGIVFKKLRGSTGFEYKHKLFEKPIDWAAYESPEFRRKMEEYLIKQNAMICENWIPSWKKVLSSSGGLFWSVTSSVPQPMIQRNSSAVLTIVKSQVLNDHQRFELLKSVVRDNSTVFQRIVSQLLVANQEGANND